MVWLKKKDQYLINISKPELKRLYNLEKNAKGKLRLLAALRRKEGNTLEEIAFSLQKPKTTIHDWLKRLEIGGIKKLYDFKQSGKPARLTKDQEKELDKILSFQPLEQSIPFVLWTTNLVQYIIFTKFNVKFKVRQVRNIIKKINFTLQVPRQEHRKANKEAQEQFKKKLKQKFNIILNSDSRSFVLMKHSSK